MPGAFVAWSAVQLGAAADANRAAVIPSAVLFRVQLARLSAKAVRRPRYLVMNIYDRFVLPRVVHFTCSRNPNMRQRAKIVPAASGKVLEIGFGSGLNLPFYDSAAVQHLWALDPSQEMWALAQQKVHRASFPVEFLEASAEDVPLPDRTVDTVVITYTLCTLPDVPRALAQVARVLRAEGHLLFCEHGLAPDEHVRNWQNRVNPLWKRFGGGCHLNRDIPALLRDGGFQAVETSSMYIPGWRPASFNYWGTATPPSPGGRPASTVAAA